MFSGKVVRLVRSGLLIREATYADLRVLILSWGLTSIKSEYTDAVMTNIRYYRTGEEDKDPVATDNMSYHQNDFAFMGLSDGQAHNQTYTIIYETKDPNTGEHKDSWKFENVEVHQGKTKDDATTSLSSVNATKITE